MARRSPIDYDALAELATVAGCPVGFSLVGWAGADEALLQLVVSLGPCRSA